MKLFKSTNFINLIIMTTCFVITKTTFSQVTGTSAQWTTEMPNKPKFLQTATDNGAFIVGTNTTDATVIDGKTGTVLWSKDFESLLGTKKCDLQYAMGEAGVLFLFRSKGSNDVLHVLDLKSGEELWSTETFQNIKLSSIIYMPDLGNFIIVTKSNLHMIEARTGKELWRTSKFTGSVAYSRYDKKRKELILLNYKTSWGALVSGYKNQILSLDVTTGEVNWDQSYFGVIHINPKTNRPVFEMIVNDNEIYLMIQGLQVLDRNTGQEKWKTDYDLFDQKPNLGAPSYTYFYKGIAYPLIAEDAIYLVYNKLASAKVMIQKIDKATGNILWEYKVDGRNNPVPNLKLEDGKLIAQLGGRINIVGPEKVGNSWVFTSRYKWVGKYGVVALDASNGNVVWEFKKLSDRITNIEVEGNSVYFADAKKLYAADITTGNVLKTNDIKSIKCGSPFEIVMNKNAIICVGDKGMSKVKTPDLSMDWNVPMSKTSENSELKSTTFLLKGAKMMHFVDITNGKIAASYKFGKGLKYSLADEAKTLFIIGTKEASRYNLK
jgi:outer membrane protein assembly factor BamB